MYPKGICTIIIILCPDKERWIEKKTEGDSALIPWEYFTEFKVKKGKAEDALTFVYQGQKYEMQLSRVMGVSENIENLEGNGFYCGSRFSE